MPPKNPAAPVPARGTIMQMFANQPKSKPKPAPQPKVKIPRQFMTLEEREAAERPRGGDLGGQMRGQMDGGDDMDIDAIGRKSPRKHDTSEPQAKAPTKPARRSLCGKLKSVVKLKEDVKMSVEESEAEGQMASGRRSPRKHASTPVPELRASRAVSGSVRRALDAGDDTDEASQSGRRSPRKHAGTPIPGSRAGTPKIGDKDSIRSLKRTASTLGNQLTKTRRTISPERRSVRFSATPTSAPRTPPRPTTTNEEAKKTPTPKQKSSSFLTPLEDTPSPPANFVTKPSTTNSSFATNGKSSQSRTVVEDSDAESEDDSDDDMIDLQTLLRNNVRPSNSLPSPNKSTKKSSIKSRLSIAASPGKANKLFGLKAMVAKMEESNRTDESVERVKKMMQDKERAAANPSLNPSGTVTLHDGHAKLLEEAVKSKAEDSGKDAQKIFKAVKRTAPIEGTEMVWQFFKTGQEKKLHNVREFPSRFLETKGPKAGWHRMFGDRKNREACMQDGFFAQTVAMDGKMGDEMFLWVLEETAKEGDEMIRHRYLEMLLSAPITMKELLTPDVVGHHFRLLGAKNEAVNVTKKMELEPIQENPHPGRTMGDHWGELDTCLRLVGHGASMISTETREAALGLILRLCADKLVRTHVTIQEAVQLALFKLSEAFTEEEWKEVSTRVSVDLYNAAPTPGLLLHIFDSIPSRPRLHNFRRRLAYASFLLCTPSVLSQPIHGSFSIDKLSKQLDREEFMMNRDATDRAYSTLDAFIQLLDIALDSGSSVTAPRLGQRHLYAHLASMGTPPPRPKLSAEELAKEEQFNSSIDTLSYKLKIIFNRIQDLGPGHAERSNCRTTIQSLGQRIEMTIRTRTKLRDSNFVMPEQARLKKIEREQERGKIFLRRFLRKEGGDGGQETPPGGEVGGADGTVELPGGGEGMDEGEEESVLDAQAEAQLLLARYAWVKRGVAGIIDGVPVG